MPVTAEELRKLAESRKPRGTPTADELRALAESKKPKTGIEDFDFGVEPTQPQPEIQEPEKRISPMAKMIEVQQKGLNKAVDVARFAWDIVGGPVSLFYPKNNVMKLQQEWTIHEVSGGKKGKPKPSNPIEMYKEIGQAAWEGFTLEQKTTVTDIFNRFVEEIPETSTALRGLKATAQATAVVGGESFDPRWQLIGQAIAPVVKAGMAKAPAFMKKPIGQLFKRGVQKKGINLAKPFYKGLGKTETTHNLIIDDEIARRLEGTFPGLTKKSGLTRMLTGRKVTEKLTPDMFSSYYDDMTGLPNSKALKKVSPYIEKYARVKGKPITVIAADVNDMKKLNTAFKYDQADVVIKQWNNLMQSQTQGQIAWFRPQGDELIGVTTMGKKETRVLIDKLNAIVQKTKFRVSTGQAIPDPLSFGPCIMSDKAKPGAIIDLTSRTHIKLLDYKRHIKWHKLDPNLKKITIGEKPMLGGKVIKFELPKVIPPNSESTLRATTYYTAVEKIGLSPDDLKNFHWKWGDKIYEIVNRGGVTDDIFDDIARLANKAGYTTKLKPMLKPKPIVKEKPVAQPAPKKGQIEAFDTKRKFPETKIKAETPEEIAAAKKSMEALESEPNLFTARTRGEQLRLGSQKLPKAKPVNVSKGDYIRTIQQNEKGQWGVRHMIDENTPGKFEVLGNTKQAAINAAKKQVKTDWQKFQVESDYWKTHKRTTPEPSVKVGAKPKAKPIAEKYYDYAGEEISKTDFDFLYGRSGEDDLWTAINKVGGIKPYKKGLPGALGEEYATNVPIHLRSKTGKPLDIMADVLKKRYSYLGIETESDLLDALAKFKDLRQLHGGIPIKSQIDRLDAFIYGKAQKTTKWFWKKLKPLYKQTVQLSDEAVEAGMPRMLEVDKPWWGRMKSLFGTQAEQKKTIELINKAKTDLFKANREFVEANPVIKKLFALTPEERHGIFAVGEGRAMPTKNISPRSVEVLKGLQDLGDQRARELLRMAKEFGLNIDGDMLVARKLQPLCVLTGKTPKEIIGEGIIDVDKLVYYEHFNPKYFKEWTGKFLKFPIRKWKSGFLKKSKGCWNYLDDAMSDPAITVPVQNAEMTEFKIRWRLINDIKEAIGKPIPKSGEMLPGYVRFEPKGKFRFYPVETKAGGSAIGVTTKGVEAFQIPSPAKTELDAFLGRAGAFEKILNMTWDKATNAWKTSVLALSPRWVVYNTLGNTTLNALGDVSPKSYIRTIGTFHTAGQMAKKQGISFNEALSQMNVPDEVFTGFYQAETGAALRNLGVGRFHAQKTWEKIANFAGWLPNKVYKGNSRIESFYRTAHYIDKIYKGYPQEKAIKSVNEFLFNYTALSWSERSIIRRIVPFYAWTKNISRLAMTYPIKHPVRVASMVLGAKAGTDYLRNEYGVRIDWSKNEVKIPVGDGVTYYVLRGRGANPFADIVTPFDLFAENGLTQMLAKINPLIKVPIERATRTQVMPWGARPFTAPVIKKDEWGREVRPLPNIMRHAATQTPQFQLYENIAKPYAKYTATGEMIIGKRGRVYPKNPVLDVLRMFGVNVRTEEMSETQKRELQKEYNDKKFELEKDIYKQRKEIVLENWEQLVGGEAQAQELQPMQPSTPTADELRALAESRR